MSGAFFREADQWDVLARAVLPALKRVIGRRRVQLWSAACGSGEAAWGLAMLVDEADLPLSVEVRILATERDPRLLARASEAVYAETDLAGVNAERRRRHFVRGAGPRRGLWRVIAPLRDQVELIELDLQGPWPALGGFDVVCCHGAFAGLDRSAAVRLVRRFADALAPGGVLLGAPAAFAEDVPQLEISGRAMLSRSG